MNMPRTRFWQKVLSIASLTLGCHIASANDITADTTYHTIDIGKTTIYAPGELRGLVEKHAPQLRFDKAASDFPMSAQEWYQKVIVDESHTFVENTDPNKLSSGQVPTYYKVAKFGNQIRINYWWYYGNQDTCGTIAGKEYGEHPGDWENITVILSEDQQKIAGVKYNQHSGWYTRFPGDFETVDGTHPVVYVGKIAHGSYHNAGGHYDIINKYCDYFDDYRKPSESNYYWSTQNNLVPLQIGAEAWMAADLAGTFRWGKEPSSTKSDKGIGTHPMQVHMQANFNACEVSFDPNSSFENWFKSIGGTEEGGCHINYQTCLAGDSKIVGDPYCFSGGPGVVTTYIINSINLGLGPTDAGFLHSRNCGVMGLGDRLYPGSSKASCDGSTKLDLSADGRLAVYHNSNGHWQWVKEIVHQPNAVVAVMQDDGNFVIYDENHHPLWATNTHQSAAHLYVFGLNIQDDGNVVIYEADPDPVFGTVASISAKWATGTNR